MRCLNEICPAHMHTATLQHCDTAHLADCGEMGPLFSAVLCDGLQAGSCLGKWVLPRLLTPSKRVDWKKMFCHRLSTPPSTRCLAHGQRTMPVGPDEDCNRQNDVISSWTDSFPIQLFAFLLPLILTPQNCRPFHPFHSGPSSNQPTRFQP